MSIKTIHPLPCFLLLLLLAVNIILLFWQFAKERFSCVHFSKWEQIYFTKQMSVNWKCVGFAKIFTPFGSVFTRCLCLWGSASVRLERLDAAVFPHSALQNSSSAVRLFWGVKSSFQIHPQISDLDWDLGFDSATLEPSFCWLLLYVWGCSLAGK